MRKYLTILFLLVCFVGNSQIYIDFKSYEYVTPNSSYTSKGYTVPFAASEISIGNNGPTYNPTNGLLSKPLRALDNDDGDERQDYPPVDPPGDPLPLGDGMWLMLFLSMIYCLYIRAQKRKSLI